MSANGKKAKTGSRREGKSMRPKEDVAKLLAGATKTLADVDSAHILTIQKAREYPTFGNNEVEVGEVLGIGGFGEVLEVTAFHLTPEDANHALEDEHQQQQANPTKRSKELFQDLHGEDEGHLHVETAKAQMSKRCLRNGSARYCVKRLRPELSEIDRTRGMIDLAVEAKYLSVLWHPNLVKMRGTSSGDLLNKHSFIILDRLQETLDKRIGFWQKEKKQSKGILGFGGDKDAKQMLKVERLVVAYDLASAFAYMHENKLVYRDIKQENIGFDIRGDVKIFDFGFTKALLPSLKVKRGFGYNLTPVTGSLPYMSPEIAQKKPYDCRCDVFSFALLLWEILALKDTANHNYQPREYFDRVVKGGERPTIHRTWPTMCKAAIYESWVADPERRPAMKRVAQMIRSDLNEISEDSCVINRTKHMKDRSSHSLRNFGVPDEESRELHPEQVLIPDDNGTPVETVSAQEEESPEDCVDC